MRRPNAIGYDVNYDVLDEFKRRAMEIATTTAIGLERTGFREVPESRGESAYLIESRSMYLAFVVEGLGTLNKIAEDMLKLTGKSYMAQVMRANLATVLNDLTACGARALIANNLVSVGDERWFSNEQARADLVIGWAAGCRDIGCAWGGGETQKLRDIVSPDSAVLAGAAVGIIKPKRRRIRGNVRPGDRMVVVESSGIHANGVTMVCDVANAMKYGYLTPVSEGITFGNALLGMPHRLYGYLTERTLDCGIPIHYVSNITGHGWRKVMRLEKQLTYVMDRLPKPQPVFRFIQEYTGASDRTMYETFNMGGGVVYFLPPEWTETFISVAEHLSFKAIDAGYVERGPRQVCLGPIHETFESDTYEVR